MVGGFTCETGVVSHVKSLLSHCTIRDMQKRLLFVNRIALLNPYQFGIKPICSTSQHLEGGGQ